MHKTTTLRYAIEKIPTYLRIYILIGVTMLVMFQNNAGVFTKCCFWWCIYQGNCIILQYSFIINNINHFPRKTIYMDAYSILYSLYCPSYQVCFYWYGVLALLLCRLPPVTSCKQIRYLSAPDTEIDNRHSYIVARKNS